MVIRRRAPAAPVGQVQQRQGATVPGDRGVGVDARPEGGASM
jgi:hypothetical protein